jgi:hypothetical protein
MTDTGSHRSGALATSVSAPTARLGLVARLRFRWEAERELHDLTTDRQHEERVLAEATVRLAPGPWQIALLFRRRP